MHCEGTGITFYALGSALIHKYRLKEYLRSYLRSTIEKLKLTSNSARLFLQKYSGDNNLDTEKRLVKLSKNTELCLKPLQLQVKEFVKLVSIQIGTTCRGAIKRIISSPSTSLSSTLHVSVISLPPNSQMRIQESQGLEVYLVMDGSGILNVDGESARLYPSCTFTIDPYKKRCLVNKGKSDFVFIRISDGGSIYDNSNYDVASTLPKSKRRRTIDMFLEGFNAISNCS